MCALIGWHFVSGGSDEHLRYGIDSRDDEPVIGASILVKGTNASTFTDNDGKFSIKIPEGAGRTLVITYIGMERQEVFARNGMVVKLTSSDQALDDVVVVGYQTIRKGQDRFYRHGEGDDLASIPETSVDKMLSGKMAGVSVSSTNGQRVLPLRFVCVVPVLSVPVATPCM